MGGQSATGLYVLTMVVVVVGVDVLFFRDHFWERLMANVGIVLVFRGVLFQVPEESVSAAPESGPSSSVFRTRCHGHDPAEGGR